MDTIIVAQVYSIRLPNRKCSHLKGWYLIVLKNGEEYMVQRNLSISSKCSQNIYKSNISMKPYIIDGHKLSEKMKSEGRTYLAVILGIFISRIVIEILPSSWIFGNFNSPFDIGVAISNLFITVSILLLSFYFLIFFRKQRLFRFITNLGGSVVQSGRVKNIDYLTRTDLGKEIW